MKHLFIFIFFTFYLNLSAQQVTGRIVNEDGEPLSQASVYYDGSTNGTISKKDGSFKIDYNQQSNLTLVVRFIGYSTLYLNNPESGTHYKITLKPEENILNEVVLDESIFSRKQMLKAFKREFLGETKAGKKARILNEDDIRFYYDKNEKSLYASAKQTVQIINKELGYKVEFDLIDFVSTYSRVTLDKTFQHSNYFEGTSFFEDISEENRRIQRKRQKAYKGSVMHFLKSLCSGNLQEEKFQLFHNSFQVPVSNIFKVKKNKVKIETSQFGGGVNYKDSYEVNIVGNDLEDFNKNNPLLEARFRKEIALLHNGERSDITFKTKVFSVDYYGNHTHINEILFSGEMSKSRMGEMLPINYEYNE